MDQTIAEVRKNARGDIRVSLTEYRGHDLCDIRVFAANDDGDPIATRKGITLNVSLIPQLQEALKAAEQKARNAGLIE